MENQDGSSRQRPAAEEGLQKALRQRKKPPSFDFYPDDFIGGTYHLSPTAIGIYVRLLCWQWSHGEIPEEENSLLRICGCNTDEWQAAWKELESKFPKANGGARRNERLNTEREHKARIREANAMNGSRRWLKGSEIAPEPPKQTRVMEEPTGLLKYQYPQSVNEVQNWCIDNGVEIDASEFFNYYESQGWNKANGTQITNWQAVARSWRDRNKTPQGKPNQPSRLFEHQRSEMNSLSFAEVFGS
jgi:uncharacterized protein YdaU (DUF1376 family)